MPVSNTLLAERIARVLAAAEISINAEGDHASAGPRVDDQWRAHLDEALAVLHTIREADEEMAQCGDPDQWTAMVETAIGSAERARA